MGKPVTAGTFSPSLSGTLCIARAISIDIRHPATQIGNGPSIYPGTGGCRRTGQASNDSRNALRLADAVKAGDHAAAHPGVNTILQFLVDKGANLNAKDILGQTPWNMAMGILSEGALRFEKLDAPHPATAALLMKFGANPVLATDLPPPPESAEESFYFRRQKGVSGDDEDSKSTSAQQ